MKSSKKQLLIALIGAFLVVSAIVTAVCIPIMQNHRIKQAQKTVSRLKELMPKIHQGSYDDRINVAMPSVELDGESFIGIIDFLLALKPVDDTGKYIETYEGGYVMKKNLAKKITLSILAGAMLMSSSVAWAAQAVVQEGAEDSYKWTGIVVNSLSGSSGTSSSTIPCLS